MLDAILSFLPIVIAVAVLLVLLLMGYVKAPPDQAYIISGLKKDCLLYTSPSPRD